MDPQSLANFILPYEAHIRELTTHLYNERLESHRLREKLADHGIVADEASEQSAKNEA